MPFAERRSMSTYLPPRPVGHVPVAGGRGPTTWQCLNCGSRNLSSSRFCGGCGTPSRIPADFVESLEAQKQNRLKFKPAVPKEPAGLIASVATFTTVSVIQQIDTPEPTVIPTAAEPASAAPKTVIPPEVRHDEPARIPAPKPASRAHRATKTAGSVLKAAGDILATFLALISHGFPLHVATRRNLAIGVTSIVIMCGFSPLQSLTSAKSWDSTSSESGKPVFWADMQSHISRRLGLSLADTELLARAAWGDVPSVNLPMTCERALAIEAIINQRGNEPLVVFPNIPFRGPLLDRYLQSATQESAPFSDVPLDHPLYDAWRPLLSMAPPPPVALQDGKACPYERIRWEEWQPLVASVWRACRPGRVPPDELLVESSGTISGGDADRSLRVLGQSLGIDIGETSFHANPQVSPSRMETLAALSRLLSAVQAGEGSAIAAPVPSDQGGGGA